MKRNNGSRVFPLDFFLHEDSEYHKAIFIGNINSDKLWETDDILKIPKIFAAEIDRIIRHCDELMLFLAGINDIVVLSHPLDNAFSDYLASYGFDVPQIEVIEQGLSYPTAGQGVLNDCGLIKRLSAYSGKNGDKCREIVSLVPYECTYEEEGIAQCIGAKLFSCGHKLNAEVNNKAFARKLAEEMGMPVLRGQLCNDLSEIISTYDKLNKYFDKIVLKELYGSSGRGLTLIENKKQLDSICKMIERRETNCKKKLLVEGWYDRAYSYNCQFLVDDTIIPYCYSQQLLVNGIFMGSVFPPKMFGDEYLIGRQMEQALEIALKVSEYGYRGIIGIDSLITNLGDVFPCIEINARINFSTIYFAVMKFLENPAVLICKWYQINLTFGISFEELLNILGEEKYDKSTKRGYFIISFGCVNANILPDYNSDPVTGRVYVAIAGENAHDALDQASHLESRILIYNSK